MRPILRQAEFFDHMTWSVASVSTVSETNLPAFVGSVINHHSLSNLRCARLRVGVIGTVKSNIGRMHCYVHECLGGVWRE